MPRIAQVSPVPMIQQLRRSLVLQLAWPVAAVLLASFAVATALSIVIGRRAIAGQMATALRSEGVAVLAEVRHYLDQRLSEVEIWASDALLDNVLTSDRDVSSQNRLLRLHRAFPNHYTELDVLSPAGRVLASTEQSRIGQTLDVGAYDLRPIENSSIRASGVVVLPGGQPAIVLAQQIASRQQPGSFGTLVAFLAWAPVEATMGRHRDAQIDEFALLVDDGGRVIAGRTRLGATVPDVVHEALRRLGTVRHASIGERRYIVMGVGDTPNRSTLGRQYRVVTFRDEGSAYSVMQIFLGSVVVAAIVGVVLAATASVVLARAASKRLHLLMDGTRRIAKGDLSHRVGGLGGDELGELASCLNVMCDELAAARSGLEALVESRTAALRDRTSALETSEARKSAIVASSLDGIVIFGGDGRVQEFNPAAERIFGVPRQDALRLFITDLVVPPAFVASEEAFLRCLKTEDELILDRRYETFGRRPAGGQFKLELTLTRIRAAGPTLFTAFVRDITEQARAEHQLREAKVAAEQAVRAKAEFLANMSHDVRTPMNGVLGITDLLSQTELSSVQAEYVELIRCSAGALVSVIDDILDYSRIEAGKLPLEHAPFDPRLEVEHLVDLLAPRAAAKGLELSAVIAPGVPSCIFGDPARVRQVLLNLLNNAVRFTPRGEVIVRLTPRSDAIEFEVADTGLGIPREALDRIFKPFSRVETTAPDRSRGTGLGLAISKQLVEAMGGRISVRSQEGHGSQFFVSLPVDTSVGPVDDRVLAAVGKRALVASNHATTRLVVRRHLEAVGLDVDEAEDSLDAWRMIREPAHGPYAAAVLDVAMVGLSLETNLEDSTPPLILLLPVSGQGDDSMRLLRPFDQFLGKPVKRSSVLATVTAALSARARSSDARTVAV
jgi:PAS domain S-box-containing protein